MTPSSPGLKTVSVSAMTLLIACLGAAAGLWARAAVCGSRGCADAGGPRRETTGSAVILIADRPHVRFGCVRVPAGQHVDMAVPPPGPHPNPSGDPSAGAAIPPSEGLPPADLTALRREYGNRPFEPEDLAPTWWEQFGVWFSDAAGLTEPNAMVLATVDSSGYPRGRTVLLKAVEPAGFLWATNYRSRKGRDLDTSGQAGLLFPWHDLQ